MIICMLNGVSPVRQADRLFLLLIIGITENKYKKIIVLRWLSRVRSQLGLTSQLSASAWLNCISKFDIEYGALILLEYYSNDIPRHAGITPLVT